MLGVAALLECFHRVTDNGTSLRHLARLTRASPRASCDSPRRPRPRRNALLGDSLSLSLLRKDGVASSCRRRWLTCMSSILSSSSSVHAGRLPHCVSMGPVQGPVQR